MSDRKNNIFALTFLLRIQNVMQEFRKIASTVFEKSIFSEKTDFVDIRFMKEMLKTILITQFHERHPTKVISRAIFFPKFPPEETLSEAGSIPFWKWAII
ncbi:MAG: hypothetical protein H0U27_05905 [Nitrosopumilus sp.]|nr:hypothetical protein [Nitrosopumilus sp.]